MTRIFLLDTNVVSDIMNGYSRTARQTLAAESKSSVIAISSITAGEVRFGIKKKGSARLQAAFDEFCLGARVLPWDDAAADVYADLRHALNRRGTSLDSLDMLIAAHAVAVDAVLVSRDAAFEQVKDMVKVVNWTTDLK